MAYPLAIIVASILFFTRGHIHRRRVEFYPGWRLAELIYLQTSCPGMQIAVPRRPAAADTWILSNLFYFLAVGVPLEPAGAELAAARASNSKSKRSELQDLQAFNQDIHPTRCEVGCSPLIWKAAFLSAQPHRRGDFTGYRFCRGSRGSRWQIFGRVFWLPGEMDQGRQNCHQRREVDFLTPDGQISGFIGISASILRTGRGAVTPGYVFNFQGPDRFEASRTRKSPPRIAWLLWGVSRRNCP